MSTANPDPSPVNPPSPQDGPHTVPDDKEETYFEGSPPLRAIMGKLLLYLLIAAFLLALAALYWERHVGPWWGGTILLILGLAMPLVPVMITKSVRYRISNYRIDFERGVIDKNIDTLELWHVEDLHFHQSLMDRMVNVGTITVISHDETMPKLELHGVPHPRPLYEQLKQRVIAVKRQRGVIKMDPG